MMAIRAYRKVVPQIANSVYVDESSQVIGQVTIGKDSSIWPLVTVRGDVNHILIGECSNIQDGSILHVTHADSENPEGYSLTIGDHVTVGHGVILHGCSIGDYCLIGMGSTILDGAVIPPYTMIGAGTLVSPGKVLEGESLWLGQPARKVRSLTDQEKDFLHYSAAHYAGLKNDYLDPV